MKKIPYEIKLIGEIEANEGSNSSIYIDKIRLMDGDKLLNLEDYGLDDDALDITISSLSYSVASILINENLPFDEYILYLEKLYKKIQEERGA